MCLLMLAVAAFAHTAEPAGPPPSDLNPAFAALLQKDGVKVMDGSNLVAEIWFRSTMPSGGKTSESNISMPTIPHGSFMGVIRFPKNGADRRGQSIKAGTYTMRFSYFPENGDHQGAAPQRDFLLLTPAAEDKDPNATPNFEALVAMSRKASGTPHPAVFSVWKGDAGGKPGISQQGEHDWVLQTKIGDTPFAMIVVGKAEG
jgi:hypothetical protein